MEYISRTDHDGIARLAIRRGKVNAFNDAVIGEMSRSFGELALDPSVRAITLTGTGKFFSFGFDIPGVEQLLERTPAKVHVHRAEREFLRGFGSDLVTVDGGDTVGVGRMTVTFIHTPGHTRGHSALFVEPDGVLYLGDIDLSSFGPYYGDAWSDPEDFERSLALVRTIEAKPELLDTSGICTMACTPCATSASAASGISVGRSAGAPTSSIPSCRRRVFQRSRK